MSHSNSSSSARTLPRKQRVRATSSGTAGDRGVIAASKVSQPILDFGPCDSGHDRTLQAHHQGSCGHYPVGVKAHHRQLALGRHHRRTLEYRPARLLASRHLLRLAERTTGRPVAIGPSGKRKPTTNHHQTSRATAFCPQVPHTDTLAPCSHFAGLPAPALRSEGLESSSPDTTARLRIATLSVAIRNRSCSPRTYEPQVSLLSPMSRRSRSAKAASGVSPRPHRCGSAQNKPAAMSPPCESGGIAASGSGHATYRLPE